MAADPLTEPLAIRPWRSGDEQLLRDAAQFISPATIASRFFVGAPVLPQAYLRHIAAAYPLRWDAVIAVSGRRLVGWAEFGRYAVDDESADLGVLVVDGWQRRRLGPALVEALLPLCRRAGVASLRAEVLESNHAARRALERMSGGRLVPTYDDGVLSYTLPTHAGWFTRPPRRPLAAGRPRPADASAAAGGRFRVLRSATVRAARSRMSR